MNFKAHFGFTPGRWLSSAWWRRAAPSALIAEAFGAAPCQAERNLHGDLRRWYSIPVPEQNGSLFEATRDAARDASK